MKLSVPDLQGTSSPMLRSRHEFVCKRHAESFWDGMTVMSLNLGFGVQEQMAW